MALTLQHCPDLFLSVCYIFSKSERVVSGGASVETFGHFLSYCAYWVFGTTTIEKNRSLNADFQKLFSSFWQDFILPLTFFISKTVDKSM